MCRRDGGVWVRDSELTGIAAGTFRTSVIDEHELHAVVNGNQLAVNGPPVVELVHLVYCECVADTVADHHW